MAEAVVSFALERVADLLITEAKLLHGVSDQIDEIQCELKRLQCFLKEADMKQSQDERVRQWVDEMRALSYRTEDVIEIFALEVTTKKEKSGLKALLRRFACILSEGASRHKIGTEINVIKAKLSNLTARLPTYGISDLKEDNSDSLVNLKNSRIFYAHDVEKDFVGMKTEIAQLISHLKRKETGWEAVSICGMGGQGKTTIAQKLYNHPEVKDRFEVFAWGCITQQFDRERVLQRLLKELLPHRKEEVSTMEDAELVKELYKIQQEKSCLIVIDDIWTVDAWRKLKSAFPLGETNSLSKLLVTTRNEKLASKLGSIHKIEGLTEEEGWQLLSRKAGLDDISDNRVVSNMEKIGRNMVKRCKGLPLAISSLGGLLRGEPLREWEIKNKDVSFHLANDDDYYTVRQVLGLSYDSLPPRLRHCFLCFANYEEDEEIETEKLYMFWMAEGLISLEDKAEGEMMLDVAERYLDELAQRSLVQVKTSNYEERSWSKYITCRVHDLIRDICLTKVKEEKVIDVFYLNHQSGNIESKGSTVRRLCIRSDGDEDENAIMLKPYDQHIFSHIRSVLVWHRRLLLYGVWPDNILSLEKFKLLRVFTSSGYEFTSENIRSISELLFLKYLCLSSCHLDELPSEVVNLRHLETLDLRVLNILTIPNVLWKLKQLKHLYLPRSFQVSGTVEKLRLNGLNVLELIENHDWKFCNTDDLLQLRKLKVFGGTIAGQENLIENIIDFIKTRQLRYSSLLIDEGGELCLVPLFECCFIDILCIITCIRRYPTEYDHTRFSGRLTSLEMVRCRMEEDPMPLLEKLPNLRSLELGFQSYLGAEMVCSANGFPQLQELKFFVLRLEKWTVEEGAMPNVSFLMITGCVSLKMLPEGLIYLTALERLYLFGMAVTFNNRVRVIDGVEGQDFYKVRHVPRINMFTENNF